jgi:excisionase family DNA binding protein
MAIAYSVAEVCKEINIGRTSVYAAIRAGELMARKVRRRTLILHDDLVAFLKSLPALDTSGK